MTNTQFKKGLKSELISLHLSVGNPIKEVDNLGVNTCIIFKYQIDSQTKEWLNNRFTNGVSFPYSHSAPLDTVALINTPTQSKQ